MEERIRLDAFGRTEYLDEQGYWTEERDVCKYCMEERLAEGAPVRFGEERYSCGEYAGRYCDVCWPKSGYRDTDEPVDWLDAGEYQTEDDY